MEAALTPLQQLTNFLLCLEGFELLLLLHKSVRHGEQDHWGCSQSRAGALLCVTRSRRWEGAGLVGLWPPVT